MFENGHFKSVGMDDMANLSHSEWIPPNNPDPQTILREVRADADAGEFETALAKHIWFHRYALKYLPSLYGVRLSFALGYWGELGKSYPAALDRLVRIRDSTRQAFLRRKNKQLRDLFHDFSSINRELDEDKQTVELFIELDRLASPKAELVFELALPALLMAKEYKLCGKYLNPLANLELYSQRFHQHEQWSTGSEEMKRSLRKHGRREFTNDVTILVALLVFNRRKSEAAKVAKAARKEWPSQAFHLALSKAMAGKVPNPWP